MNKFLRATTASILLGTLASCSLAVPSTQKVTVTTTAQSAKIYANGAYAGTSPVVIDAKRNKTLALIAKKPGYQPGVATVKRQFSETGMLDVVGGLFLGVPFFGLLAPGAWKLEQDNVTIPMSR